MFQKASYGTSIDAITKRRSPRRDDPRRRRATLRYQPLFHDQTVCELFDVPCATNDTTLRDDLFLIGQKDNERAELLLRLNEQLFDKLQLKSIIIDLDGTALPVDGHQEGAEKGIAEKRLNTIRCNYATYLDVLTPLALCQTFNRISGTGGNVRTINKPALPVIQRKSKVIKQGKFLPFYFASAN